MKKLIFVFLLLNLMLCGCAQKNDEEAYLQTPSISGENSDSLHSTDEESEYVTNIYVTYFNEGRYLSSMYEFPLKTALETGEWKSETPDCASDFTIKYGGKTFSYHSECGSVILDGNCKQLSDYYKENVNKLLFSLFEINA